MSLLAGNAEHVESLEHRLQLAGSPLPTLAMLENPNNPVVRIETLYGDVDIELFQGDKPITVANFLNYVRTGRFDETFFHRKTTFSSGIEVLQGGGFLYDNVEGVRVINRDPAIVLESANFRSNVERTIAMARTNQPNSATNQFYFNISDNTVLDPGTNPGFIVFGRVIQGWDAIITMWSFPSQDLNSDPAFAGTAVDGAMGEVPVTPDYSPVSGVRENGLARLINAEIIKPQDFAGFFTHRSVMPEGFNSAGATEFVELFNPNPFSVRYQLIARYEAEGNPLNFVAGDRESVISSGTIDANRTLRIAVSGTDSANITELTRDDVGYAFVLETATPAAEVNAQPLAASIVRFDFGGIETSEAFVNVNTLTNAEMRDWAFARLDRNADSLEFITMVNLSEQTATVTVDVVTPEGPRTFSRTLEGHRRSGVALAEAGLADGLVAVRLRSTQNIVAVASDWTSATRGTGTLISGAPGGGSTRGAVSGVINLPDRDSFISVYNPGTTAIVTFRVWRTGITDPIESNQIALPNSRTDFPLSQLAPGLGSGERVTVTYNSGSSVLAVQYTTLGAGTDDGASSMLARSAATVTHFAEGRAAAGSNQALNAEVVSIFNPFAGAGQTLSYSVVYSFSDGTRITGATGTLAPNGRIDITTMSDPAVAGFLTGAVVADNAVRTKILSLSTGTGYRPSYTISVSASVASGEDTISTSGVVTLTRFMGDISRVAISDAGFHAATALPLTDPRISL